MNEQGGIKHSFERIVIGDTIEALLLALSLSSQDTEGNAQVNGRSATCAAHRVCLSGTFVNQNDDVACPVRCIIPCEHLNLFHAIGIDRAFFERNGCFYHSRNIRDAEGTAEVNVSNCDVGQESLGCIISERLLTLKLLERVEFAVDQGLLSVQRVSRYLSLAEREGLAQIVVSTNDSSDEQTHLSASLVIAADGMNSNIRRLAGIPVERIDYPQLALWATVRCERGHSSTIFQRFDAERSFSLLPDADEKQVALFWSLPAEEVNAMINMPRTELIRRIELQSETIFGSIEDVENVKFFRQDAHLNSLPAEQFNSALAGPSFAISQIRADRYVQPAIALVGDAAQCLHPMAGQSLQYGLADVSDLLEAIRRDEERGIPPGNLRSLTAYQRKAKSRNLAAFAKVNLVNRMFSSEQLELQWLRNQGMRVINRVPGLKRWFW